MQKSVYVSSLVLFVFLSQLTITLDLHLKVDRSSSACDAGAVELNTKAILREYISIDSTFLV